MSDSSNAGHSDTGAPIGTPDLYQARPTWRRWIIFVFAAGTSFILYLHRYTWNFVRDEIKQEYEFNNLQVDSIGTAFNATYTLGQIPGGVICDLIGPHLFLGIIIAVWSLALPLLGVGKSVGVLSFWRVLFGAGQAGCYPSLAKVTREWFPARSRTSVQGLVASFFGRSGGAMSSLIFATFLMGYCGLTWQRSLLVLGAAGVVFAGLFLWQCRNRPEEDSRVNDAEVALIRGDEGPQTESGDQPRVLPIGRALRNRALQIFLFQQSMNAGADYVYATLMGSFFREAKNVTDMVALGALAAMPLFGGAFGGIASGFLNDILIRITGRRRIARSIVGFSGKFIACYFLYAVVVYPAIPVPVDLLGQTIGGVILDFLSWIDWLDANPSDEAISIAGLLFLTKFFTDWTQPTVWGTSTDLGGRYSATVFSIVNASGGVGGIITPLVGGWLLDRYMTFEQVNGQEVATTHYEPVFIMVGAMYMISALCWLFINSEDSLDKVAPNEAS